MGKYDDIINLPHHISRKHPQMSLEARSAQFASFAALKGFEDEVEETARTTIEKIELNDEAKNILDRKLQYVRERIKDGMETTFTYFVKDNKKSGGTYIKETGLVKKIDEYNNLILLENGIYIPIQDIYDIKYSTPLY